MTAATRYGFNRCQVFKKDGLKSIDKNNTPASIADNICVARARRYRSEDFFNALVSYNLVTPQLGILRVINEAGSVSQQDIGDFVVIDKASMVKFIDQLEKLKLVNRTSHETDRRIKLISLTPKGKKTLEIVAEVIKEVEAVFLQPLTEEEQQQLRNIVPKLLL
tara:strand:- start:19789 stop:20280 length:492 start_codon:yes stop_codon:yes gene_type:complete